MSHIDPFTGFGDDTNTSVKFQLVSDGGKRPNWSGGPRINQFEIPNSNDVKTQNGGRKPWRMECRLLFDTIADFDALDAVQGARATLRYSANVTSSAGGTVETILGVRYLTLTETLLLTLEPEATYRSGQCTAIATFQRSYVEATPPFLGNPYPVAILATPGLIGYWRLGEASGTVAGDESPATNRDGAYTGTATAPSLLAVDSNPARSFDGALDEVLIPYNADFDTAHLTVEIWFTLSAWEVDAAIANRRTTGGTMGWSFQISASGQLRFDCFIGGGFRSVNTTGWGLSTTYYVACTYDGTTLRVYRGTAVSPAAEIGNTAFTGSINAPVDAQIKIGRTVTVADTITGVIDEVAIYNVALGAATILAHHNTGLGT